MILLLFLLFLTACAKPDISTSHGVNVYNDTPYRVTEWQVELMTELLIEEQGRGRKILKGTDIYIEEELRGDKNGLSESESKNVFVRYNPTEFPCFAATALQHELTHVIRYHIEKNHDFAHNDVRYWEPQKKAKFRAQMLSCPPDTWDSIPEHIQQQGPWP